MFCSNCGKEIETNAKFCPNCGINISSPQTNNYSRTFARPKIDFISIAIILITLFLLLSGFYPIINIDYYWDEKSFNAYKLLSTLLHNNNSKLFTYVTLIFMAYVVFLLSSIIVLWQALTGETLSSSKLKTVSISSGIVNILFFLLVCGPVKDSFFDISFTPICFFIFFAPFLLFFLACKHIDSIEGHKELDKLIRTCPYCNSTVTIGNICPNCHKNIY